MLDLMIEEFLGETPKDLTQKSVDFLAEKRNTIKKWLHWQAYWLQRRNITDTKNSQVIFGSLIQIKAMIHLIDESRATEEHPKLGEVKTISKYKEHIEGVDKFTKTKLQ